MGHFLFSYPSRPGTVGLRKWGKKKSEKAQGEEESWCTQEEFEGMMLKFVKSGWASLKGKKAFQKVQQKVKGKRLDHFGLKKE